MPDPIICPHCREQLDIPAEYHSRPVRCASCQNVFTATPEGDVPVAHRLPARSGHAGQPRPARRAPDGSDGSDGSDDRPPRKSNVPVVLGLLFVALTVGGCCGGFNLLLVTQTNPTLTPYTSAEGQFKVEFPGQNPTSGPTTNPADEKLTGVQVTAAREYGQEQYTVRTYELKADWQKLPAGEALEKVAKAELEALKAGPEVRRETDIKHQGFPALDLMAGDGNGLTGRDTMVRCVLAGKRVYVVAHQAQKIQPEYWWVRQYFLSFEITDPAAKPPKDDEPKREKKQD